MILHGPAVTLRPLDERHAEQTREWANDLALGRLLDRARPVSDTEHARWLTSLHGDDRVFFAVESGPDARHIGNVWLWGIDPRHRKAEVRVLIGAADYQGRGQGSESIGLIADYARDRLNLRRLYAMVLSINPRGRRAFEKAGFQLEGILRQDRWVGDDYADVWLLGKLL